MKIINAGANVILLTGGIDELCQKYCLEANVMAVRRCRKIDLKRIAKATGGQLIASLANMEGEETFEPAMLGEAEEVVQERISDDELILVKGSVSLLISSAFALNGKLSLMIRKTFFVWSLMMQLSV